MPKVLHITHTTERGGAARAVLRIHESLMLQNVDSIVFSLFGECTVDKIIPNHSVVTYFWLRIIHRINLKGLFNLRKENTRIFSFSFIQSSESMRVIRRVKPDIIHLHWVAGGAVNFKKLSSLKVPVVWTIHDDNPFTAGCHTRWNCEAYVDSCSNCPIISPIISKRLFNAKRGWYKGLDLTIVSVSESVQRSSEKSELFFGRKNVVIGNPIFESEFVIKDKDEAKKKYGIPRERKVVVFGAMNAETDFNKGLCYLLPVLQKMIENDEVSVCIFGVTDKSSIPLQGPGVLLIGRISNNEELSEIYSMGDVFVVPSLQESFGQTATESLCCGTPVVCFGGTGLDDIVNESNGYKAAQKNKEDLENGIRRVLAGDYLPQNLREGVLSKFSHNLIAEKYLDLYLNLLNET